MEISKTCPKCGKDYSEDPYWKSSLKKHLERKNPCDRKRYEKYIRINKKVVQPEKTEKYEREVLMWRLLII
jgi:hypothetical protein